MIKPADPVLIDGSIGWLPGCSISLRMFTYSESRGSGILTSRCVMLYP